MPKVTVVVPCLNMEKYIHSCLKSILDQTLWELEVIVVDAGSVDGTQGILEDFAKLDKRVKIVHSDKKSYGYQVNLGVEQAAGQYIALVDADDRVATNMYETLYREAVQSNADYVKGTARAFYTITENIVYSWSMMQFSKEEYTGGKLICVPADRSDLLTRDNFLWYGIFKAEFLKGIRLHESLGAAFQDLGGLLQTQMKAQKAVYLNESFYEYRQDNVSASQYNPKGFRFVWEEYTWAEPLVADATNGWREAFYRKWFLHTLDRYYAMAASETFWEEALIYIDLIRDKFKTVLAEKTAIENVFQESEREDLRLFLMDGYRLYIKYREKYLSTRDTLKSMLKVVQNQETVIFGSGNYGTFLFAQMVKYEACHVVAFCDNMAELQGKHMWDIPILTPAEAARLYPDSYYVIANRNHGNEMRTQLMDLGIGESRIYQYTAGWDIRLLGDCSVMT